MEREEEMMDSKIIVLIVWAALIVIIMSVVGYLLLRVKPDPSNPNGADIGNAFWYKRLGRKK